MSEKAMQPEKSDIGLDMMSVIAHQIRSPLATIRLSNQTLLENEEGNLTERQIYMLQQADSRAARIYALTEELLRVGGSAHDREIVKEEASLESLIKDLLEQSDVAIKAKDLQVDCEFSDSGKDFPFDKSLLSDAVINLLDNAIDYTPEGGTITIKTEYDDEFVTFSISDTGPGIKESDTTSLFKKFGRLQKGVDAHGDGLGLGLYIAKTVAEQHGGSIWYEHNKPHGSTFAIRLPLNK